MLLQESTQGAYTGVGLTMSKYPDSGVVSVVDLAEGGPAEQAGIQKGDILTAVDGKDITEKELSEISTIIREDNKKQKDFLPTGQAAFCFLLFLYYDSSPMLTRSMCMAR